MNETYIKSSNFTNNIAKGNGGVLFLSDFQDSTGITIKDCIFSKNTASSTAGVIYIAKSPSSYLYTKSKIDIKHSNFTNNKAILNAAVLFLESYSDITINFSNFAHNKAIKSGGVA